MGICKKENYKKKSGNLLKTIECDGQGRNRRWDCRFHKEKPALVTPVFNFYKMVKPSLVVPVLKF